MDKHRAHHEGSWMDEYQGQRNQRLCSWLNEDESPRADVNSDLAGYGHDRCNGHEHLVVDGLRYDTRTADLVAIMDGRDFGQYLFKTPGRRFFAVRINYPLRGESTRPLEAVSDAEARMIWAYVEQTSYGQVAPYVDVFGQEIKEA